MTSYAVLSLIKTSAYFAMNSFACNSIWPSKSKANLSLCEMLVLFISARISAWRLSSARPASLTNFYARTKRFVSLSPSRWMWISLIWDFKFLSFSYSYVLKLCHCDKLLKTVSIKVPDDLYTLAFVCASGVSVTWVITLCVIFCSRLINLP
jgi:hypothetical protein